MARSIAIATSIAYSPANFRGPLIAETAARGPPHFSLPAIVARYETIYTTLLPEAEPIRTDG